MKDGDHGKVLFMEGEFNLHVFIDDRRSNVDTKLASEVVMVVYS